MPHDSRYPEPEWYCAFGSLGFDETKSNTFVYAFGKKINASYGDGDFVTGDVGFDTMTIGSLTVTNQEIALVKKAAWRGDNVTTVRLGRMF